MRILMPNEHSYMVSVLEEWNGWFRIDNPIQVLDTEEDLYCDGEMPTLWIHSSLIGCTTRVDVQLLRLQLSPYVLGQMLLFSLWQ